MMGAPTKAGLGVLDAAVLDRSNHTGTQAQSTITGLPADLVEAKDRANHTGAQAISTVTGLQTALDSKLTAGAFLSTGSPGAGVLISGGVLTVTKTHTLIDTEGGAATDDLDSISGGSIGDILILGTSSGTRDVTVKNGANIVCGSDRVLSTTAKKIVLLKTASTAWTMLAFADN